MHQLEFSGVAKRYHGGVDAVSNVNFILDPGITGLLGPNGAGKSTLKRIAATVARPTAGTVRWDGTDVVRNALPLRRVLGYLPQDSGVYPHLDTREFLGYIAALKGLSARHTRRQIEELLRLLDLEPVARRPLGTLSGGNRQRVSIAQALLGDPQMLIVDEPTAGLDPEQRMRLRELLKMMARERIVLFSTHIVSDVETVADRIIIIAGGRVIADGSRADITGTSETLESAYLSRVGGTG